MSGCRAERAIGRTEVLTTIQSKLVLLMKMHVEFRGLPASARWFFLIQSFVHALKKQLRIARARTTIEQQGGRNPSFHARMHLEIPGPDVRAEASGFTLMEAWQKACEAVELKIQEREEQKSALRKRARERRLRKR